MAITFRCTSLFSGREQGWSEPYVYQTQDGTTPEQFFNGVIRNIAQKRAAMLGAQYTLDAVRIALIRNNAGQPVKRNVRLFQAGYVPNPATPDNGGEQPNACVLMEFSDQLGTRKMPKFVGGPPDSIFKDGGVFDGAGEGGWVGRFTSWNQANLNANAGWLEDLVSVGPLNLVGYIVNANKTVTFTIDGDMFVISQVGDIVFVRVSGVNNGSVLNGALTVRVTTQATCTTVKPIAVFPYSSGGLITSYVDPKPFIAAFNTVIVREGTHKRGRPSNATRGRLKARARG